MTGITFEIDVEQHHYEEIEAIADEMGVETDALIEDSVATALCGPTPDPQVGRRSVTDSR